jgi:penicillin-binding protein 1A
MVVAAIAIAGGSAGVYMLSSSCDLSARQPVEIGQNTFVYAADGSLLGSIPAEVNRQPVPLDQTGSWMAKATVAVEDRRFYEHGGVDLPGILRAAYSDIRAGELVEGGSTITQQLVRNLYISRERTVKRKLREVCLSIKLNRAWPKERILATYLNQVPYGNRAFGVEAAAQTYFGRKSSSLTLSQAALLAGLTQAPSAYDPFLHPAAALQRRGDVLDAMLDTGAITVAQHARASRAPLGLRPGRLYSVIREPTFFGYVRDELIRVYGQSRVRSGGLRVYTTVQPG